MQEGDKTDISTLVENQQKIFQKLALLEREGSLLLKYITVLVELITLLSSLVTTINSWNRIKKQDLKDTKRELRQLIQRIQAIPIEITRLQIQSTRIAEAQYYTLMDNLKNESVMLAHQVIDIAKSNYKNLSSGEAYAISEIMFSYGRASESVEFARLAVNRSPNVSAQANAFRALGITNYLVGDPTEGDKAFRGALELLDKDANRSGMIITLGQKVTTHLAWARVLLKTGGCDNAKLQLAQSKELISRYPPSANQTQYQSEVRDLETLLSQCDGNPSAK